MVAGGALEADTPFEVRCNCGGTAPLTPRSVKGYGFSKKGGAVKVVDRLAARCESCRAKITAIVLEGDPGYVLTSNGGVDELFLPQGSSSPPVSSLSNEQRQRIIESMKADMETDGG